MEFKGTKGKWEYPTELWHNTSYENGLWMYTKKGNLCQTLCEVNGSGISKQEALSNAKLISKAPEMLEDKIENLSYMEELAMLIPADYWTEEFRDRFNIKMHKTETLIKEATTL